MRDYHIKTEDVADLGAVSEVTLGVPYARGEDFISETEEDE